MPLRYPLALCALAILLGPAAAAQHGAPPSLEPFDGFLEPHPAPIETAAALAPSRVLDALDRYSWQTASESWGEPTSRDVPTYDANGWEIERLQETRTTDGGWRPTMLTAFTRDDLGRVVEEYQESTAGTSPPALRPSRKTTREWFADTDLSSSTRTEVWQEGTGWYLATIQEITWEVEGRWLVQSWVSYNAAGEVLSSQRTENTYAEGGQYLGQVRSRLEGGDWQIYERVSFTQGNPGEPDVALLETRTPEGTWALSRRTISTSTPERYVGLTEETLDDGATWRPHSRLTDTYDASGNRTEQLQEQWNGSSDAWIATAWFQWTYDQRGLRMSEDVRARNPTTGALFLHYTGSYSYDEEGDLVEWVRQERRQEAVPLQNQIRHTYTYRPFQVSTDAGPVGLALSLETFPNPALGRATVRFELAAPSTVQVSVYDLLGRRVATLADGEHPPGSHLLPLDARDLAAGPYLVRLQAEASVLTRRLTVLR
jgi:hypothetical protein